jgi:AcrR family transcriptional regulator
MMETMETRKVSPGSDGGRVDLIIDAAGRLFLGAEAGRGSMDDLARALGMSKKTIYRHFPDKHSLMTAVLDRQFGAIERTRQFLVAACGELARIGAAQLATGRGDALLRRHVEQRIDAVVYRRLDELYQDGYRQGLLAAPPELLGEITRGAVERLLNSQLPLQLACTAADRLRATVDTVLYGAIRPADRKEEARS